MKFRILKINFSDKTYKAGQEVKLRCDKNGQPLSSFWRKMLKNAESDNCVEWIPDKKSEKPKQAG